MISRRLLLKIAAPAIIIPGCARAAPPSVDQGTTALYRQPQIRGADTYNLAGRTQQSAVVTVSPATALIVTVGQSTSNNSINSLNYYLNFADALDPAVAYTPTNGNLVQNLSIGNKGAIFNCVDPLLGGELLLSHYGPRLADKLINGSTYGRVILATIAIGGSYAADWAFRGGIVGGAMAGTVLGELNYRIGLLARCLQYVGLLNNPNLAKTMILWQQGEWDSDPTNTTSANYQLALNNVINTFRLVGFPASSVPFYIATCTRPGAAGAATIQAAQAAVVNNPAGIYAGANTDSIGSTTADRYDGTHFVGTSIGSGHGSDQQANLWQSAILAGPH